MAIKDGPITSFDVKAAEVVFGTNIDAIQGKITSIKPNMVKPYYLDISRFIIRKYKYVTLSRDVMFINRTPLILTVVCLLLMGICKNIPSTKSVYTLKAIKIVVQLYTKRRFKIVQILLDGKFEPMRGELFVMGINVNIVSANKHVP